jgi:monoterpene epsilon-lactone hydrolase
MRLHQRVAQDGRVQDHGLRLYSIRIRGHLGATLLAAFPQMVPQQLGTDCILTGVLPDNSALFGVLAEIETLGLELIEIRRLVPKPESPDAQ